MKILLVGAGGSIGRKHLQNLILLGESEIDLCDPALETAKYKDIYDIPTLGVISNYDLIIIASPTDLHLEHLHFCNARGAKYIMVEKPLYRESFQAIFDKVGMPIIMKQLTAEVYVNDAYYFEPGLQKLKEVLPMVGDIWHVNMENSYSFAKLHKYSWTNYDGVIFDDVHIVDVSLFLFGQPKKCLSSMVRKDIAEFTWETEKGFLVSHRTDVLGQRYKKRVEVKGDKGSLIYNFRGHELFFAPADESERIAIAYKKKCHLFESLKYVVETVRKKGVFEINTIEDHLQNLIAVDELERRNQCGRS